MREGMAHPRRDAGGTGTIVDRGVDGLIVKEGVDWLQRAREEDHFGVETGVEQKGSRRAECPREAGFERCVNMVVDEEAGAA